MSDAEDVAVRVDYLSDLALYEARALIGQEIVAVEADEYDLLLTFASGSRLLVHGHMGEDASLGVNWEPADPGA